MPELATFALFTYRHEAFVAEAIRSVAKQTYRPLELIISDDASPDETRQRIDEALRDFPADIPVIRINHAHNHGGLPAVINAAVRRETAYSQVEQRLLRTRSLLVRAGQVALAWSSRRIGTAKAVKLFTLFVTPFLYKQVLGLRIWLSERKRLMRHG